MYNPEKQYRCTIIRGKSQTEMDDLLPIYARIIDEICPCESKAFEELFNKKFAKYLTENKRTKKTFDNHRTEVAGRLFGMYYQGNDSVVYESDRTKKFLSDNDQPAFFKDLCYKMQFPNGMQKIATIMERKRNKISIRPNAFLLKFLLLAEEEHVDITKREIGYYILNSLDVLQGIAEPKEVLSYIIKDQKAGITRNITVPGKQHSYNWQHIDEQLNYLELANLIRIVEGKRVCLNNREREALEIFAEKWHEKPEFNVYKYDLDDNKAKLQFKYDWDLYFSKLSNCVDEFTTSAKALVENQDEIKTLETKEFGKGNLVALGDEGEAVVYEYERNRVGSFNKRLVNRVLALGKTKGLGYDIQSVVAEKGDTAEFVKYIEVKTTKRTTSPKINDVSWNDNFNITRNEWLAAQQFAEMYSIFRVYFTRDGILIYIINNPYSKKQNKKIEIVPLTYRVDFGKSSIDAVILDGIERK